MSGRSKHTWALQQSAPTHALLWTWFVGVLCCNLCRVSHSVSSMSMLLKHAHEQCLREIVVWGCAVSPSGSGSGQTMWLPTSCLQLLQRICAARANHVIIAADFDALPDVTVPGQGGPLVASTVCLNTCSLPAKNYATLLHAMCTCLICIYSPLQGASIPGDAHCTHQ